MSHNSRKGFANVLFLALALALAGVAGYFLFSGRPRQADFVPTPLPAIDTRIGASGNGARIVMGDAGFLPSEVTIVQGQIISFVNGSTHDHWPASNIHPTHQVYPAFDPRAAVEPAHVWQFKFDRVGEWRFHDHLYPEFTGIIHVLPVSAVSADIGSGHNDAAADHPIFSSSMEPGTISTPKGPWSDVKIFSSISDEAVMRYWLKKVGTEAVMAKLLQESGGGAIRDCHQDAHQIGRISYAVFGASVFRRPDTTCHSGFIHGAMEAFLQQEGTADISQKSQSICAQLGTGFSRFECLHGMGHGIMAYYDYDLRAALATCTSFIDEFSRGSCFGGAFMENIILENGRGVLQGHTTKWLNDDPLFPCDGVDQSSLVQSSCYLIQTARMLQLFRNDFKKVSDACLGAPDTMRSTCFQSMGRDAAGQTLRDPLQTLGICKYSPKEFFNDCIRGALYSIAEFSAEKMIDQPHKLCNMVDDPEGKNACYQALGSRLPDFFGGDKEKIKGICSRAGEESQRSCLQGAGIAPDL